MARCPVCGAGGGNCTSTHYSPPIVPDLLNEGGPYVAKPNTTTIRMPEQHVREGRGVPGYKSTDEATVEVYKTEDPFSSSRSSSSRKSKADWVAEAEAAGVEGAADMTIPQLKEALGGNGEGD